jgi:hypothetical protein
MVRVRGIIAAGVLVFAGLRAFSAAPELAAGQRLYSGDSLLVVQDDATPEVVDWNNDGRPDLLVGQYGNGRINLFLNLSSNTTPFLGTGSFVESSGSPIQTSYG